MTLKFRSRGDLSRYSDCATGLELEGSLFDSREGQDICLVSEAFRSALRPTLSIKWTPVTHSVM